MSAYGSRSLTSVTRFLRIVLFYAHAKKDSCLARHMYG